MTLVGQTVKRVAIGLLSVAVVFVCEAKRSGLTFKPNVQTNAYALAYLAPVSLTTVRMVQPDGLAREFERDPRHPEQMVGAFGWVAEERGDSVIVTSGRDVTEGVVRLTFVEGRLRQFERAGKVWKFPQSAMPPRDGSVLDLWPKAASRRQTMRDHDIWRNTGRLRLWFVNPNRAGLFFAELGLLALGMLVFRRRSLKIAGLVAAVVSFFFLMQTGSRGGVLAFLAGGGVLILFRVRHFLARAGRRAWTIVAIVSLIGLFIFFAGAPRVTHDLLSTREGGNRIRLQVLSAVPRMMVDAPQGWGWYADGLAKGAGKAYVDWYQPMKNLQLMLTLVSDHLTQLVNRGWWGRFGYLVGWFALLALLVGGCCRGVSPMPLALWTAFLVATGLNRVIEAWMLWILPVGVTLAAVPALWRARGWRWLSLALSVAVVAAGTTLLAFSTLGSRPLEKRELPIRADQRRVFVKCEGAPDRWIVDDGAVLGGGLTANEIRYFYRQNKNAQGLGYVRNVFDLPDDVHKVVLAGYAGWEFLMGLNEGKFPATFNVPEEILFISPPFPPRAIPELLLKNAKIMIVTGEFMAAFFEEYRNPPDWVTVVPGTELYIPGWMNLVVGAEREEEDR